MAQIRAFSAHECCNLLSRRKNYWKILIFFALTSANIYAPSARAQLQQPLVFSSGGAVAARNDQTGALAPVSGSPFLTPSQAPASGFTLDVQGRFLFAIGTNSIRMFQITDSTTGAFQEVCDSPFASPSTNQPSFIAVEPTGQYLAVVNRVGKNPGDASVETFLIAPSAPISCPNTSAGPALVPVAGSATELDSAPVGFAQPPDNNEFLLFLGPNPQSQNLTIQNGSEFQSLSIDSQTGLITGLQAGTVNDQQGDSFAMDPQGRYYVTGTQDKLLQVGNIQTFGIGGQLPPFHLTLNQFNYPIALWIDSTGSFIYAATSDLNNPVVVNIYSINLQTGNFALTASSPLPGATSVPAYYPDPTGSFNFGSGADANTAMAYTVDPVTGYFIETANSPFAIPQIAGALSFSIPPGQQGISGPSVSLSSTNLSFGSVQTGSSSTPQTVTLTSNGGQALSVNSIALSGADPGQFFETDTCQTPSVLQPNKFCSISVVFIPNSSGAGSQQATLMITDNAPGSPQFINLSGEGVAPPPPAPAVSVSPDPVSFPTITQGTASSPITIVVTNSGNATLQFSSVVIAGNNMGDFTTTSACSGSLAPKATCNISVTFAPLAAGERTETITLTDNASDSPQVIHVGGDANPAVTLGAAPAGSTTAMVAAGQSAQYNLQLTPGAGYAGTVSLTCNGAPTGATCQVPSSLQITTGNTAPFTVTVTTSGGALILPFSIAPRATPFPGQILLLYLAGGILLTVLFVFNPKAAALQRQRRKALGAAFASLILSASLTVSGCGGGAGSATTLPPQIITPQGTSTITVTPTAMSTSGKPLQLTPIQLTLTVN